MSARGTPDDLAEAVRQAAQNPLVLAVQAAWPGVAIVDVRAASASPTPSWVGGRHDGAAAQ
jgi:hypothetical protein